MSDSSAVSLLSCFLLADTPGVHLHHRLPHMLSPEQLRLLHPRKRLAGATPPTPAELSLGGGDEELQRRAAARKSGGLSGSYVWSDLVRVDVVDGPGSTWLQFFGPSSMLVAGLPLLAPGEVVQLEDDDDDGGGGGSGDGGGGAAQQATVLRCADSVAARGGLVPHSFDVLTNGSLRPLADIAVSGLPGWVAVGAPGARGGKVRLVVWAPRGVEVFLRPSLPCPLPPRVLPDGANGEGDDGDGGGFTAAQLEELVGQGGDGDGGDMYDPSAWEGALAWYESINDGDNSGDAGSKGRRGGAAANGDDEDGGGGDDDDGPSLFRSSRVQDVLQISKVERLLRGAAPSSPGGGGERAATSSRRPAGAAGGRRVGAATAATSGGSASAGRRRGGRQPEAEDQAGGNGADDDDDDAAFMEEMMAAGNGGDGFVRIQGEVEGLDGLLDDGAPPPRRSAAAGAGNLSGSKPRTSRRRP